MALIDPAPIDIRNKNKRNARQKDNDNPVSFLAVGTLCVLRKIHPKKVFLISLIVYICQKIRSTGTPLVS